MTASGCCTAAPAPPGRNQPRASTARSCPGAPAGPGASSGTVIIEHARFFGAHHLVYVRAVVVPIRYDGKQYELRTHAKLGVVVAKTAFHCDSKR
jgi:hypothetical protein